MERHFLMGERPLTFEELEEKSRNNPRRVVQMRGAELTFTQQGEFELSEFRSMILFQRCKTSMLLTIEVEFSSFQDNARQ